MFHISGSIVRRRTGWTDNMGLDAGAFESGGRNRFGLRGGGTGRPAFLKRSANGFFRYRAARCEFYAVVENGKYEQSAHRQDNRREEQESHFRSPIFSASFKIPQGKTFMLIIVSKTTINRVMLAVRAWRSMVGDPSRADRAFRLKQFSCFW